MIRRFYFMPLTRGVPEERVAEFVRALSESDRFISGLLESSAGVDPDSRTVVWEMNFVDEETYTSQYMMHPYHMATLDSFLIADSPERVAHDIHTMRYQASSAVPRMENGIRRIVLFNLPQDADTSVLEELAARGHGMSHSVFSADNVPWRFPGKRKDWTHIWEQSFADMEQLDQFLKTPDAIASSNLEGFKRLGVDVLSLKSFTVPFSIKPSQSPPAVSSDAHPIFYTSTARLDPNDIDTYIGLLERDYDPSLAGVGANLVHRWRTVEYGYGDAEVHSTWQLDSVAAFSALRIMTATDASWNRFVLNGMPLVKGGTRRFYRAV